MFRLASEEAGSGRRHPVLHLDVLGRVHPEGHEAEHVENCSQAVAHEDFVFQQSLYRRHHV